MLVGRPRVIVDQHAGSGQVTRGTLVWRQGMGKWTPAGEVNELADLFVKKGYYAKIETMTTIGDTKVSEAKTTDFLTYALPEVHKCMPDWDKVVAAEQPAEQVAAK